MTGNGDRTADIRVLRAVETILTEMRRGCRPRQVDADIKPLLDELQKAERAVGGLSKARQTAQLEIGKKLEKVLWILDVTEEHVSAKRRTMAPAEYGLELVKFVSALAGALDEAIELVSYKRKGLRPSEVRRQTHSVTIDLPDDRRIG
ncbi:hypothetical protein ACIRSS_23060 [Amycolatopsis sp. NPDC101161]|uniref:hypothetical protein n=1 Tax=Amycolatopsis sp. NPDC101161 TaxID=3363940 RepID=UPI0038200F74